MARQGDGQFGRSALEHPRRGTRHLSTPRPWRHVLLAGVALLVTSLVMAQTPPNSQPDQARIEAQSRAFGRLPAKEQERILQVMRGSIEQLDEPSVRAMLGAHTRAFPQGQPLRSRVVPAATTAAAKAASRQLRLRALLAGDVTEGAIAAGDPSLTPIAGRLLASIDTDRSVQCFAAFLGRWRNGEESFYQALVRTAGSGEGVFHYDAMFAEWQRTCVPKGDAAIATFRRSTDDAQRGFRKSFEAYWHYRSLREAFVASVLLDPDVPLPAGLQRFEQALAGGYSMRDCFVLLAALHHDDVLAMAEAFVTAMRPMPERHWSSDDHVYEDFQAMFAAALPRMLELAPHTDQLLAQSKDRLRARHRAISSAAVATLGRELRTRP